MGKAKDLKDATDANVEAAQVIWHQSQFANAVYFSQVHMWERHYHPGDESPRAKKVTEHVCCEDRYGSDESVTHFRKWLDKQIASIPAKLRPSARIKIDSIGGYEGEHHAEIEITYTRSETKEEIAERRAGYAAQLEREAAKRKAEFDALKDEFCPAPCPPV